MTPLPPGLFSTITRVPRLVISSASMRTYVSVPPPGLNGTTIFVIPCWATAEPNAVDTASNAPRMKLRTVISSPSLLLRGMIKPARASRKHFGTGCAPRNDRMSGLDDVEHRVELVERLDEAPEQRLVAAHLEARPRRAPRAAPSGPTTRWASCSRGISTTASAAAPWLPGRWFSAPLDSVSLLRSTCAPASTRRQSKRAPDSPAPSGR